MTAAAAGAMIIREKRIVAAFQAAGATSPDRAVTREHLSVHAGAAWRRLQRRAVLREAEPDRWYLDLPSWDALRALRQRLVIVVFAIGAVVLFGALLAR